MSYPIRILHIEIRGGIGGIETFLLNLYTAIDKQKVQFDFISTANTVALEKKFTDKGACVYKIPEPLNIFKYYKSLKEIIKKNGYTIVHIHKNSAANIIPFIICKKLGIKTIVAHSHNTAPIKGRFSKILHRINRKRLLNIKTDAFACSELAAKWLYGTNYINKNGIQILKNGIDTQKFVFNSEVRKKVRNKLGINNSFVIGHVGRLMKQKNQEFLIDIFYKLLDKKANSVLVLCGMGELENELRTKVKKLNIEKKVLFLGSRTDINEIMQAMDVFVLPSLYEGLPVVGIEAQCSGLPMIVSDTVSSEIKISNLVTFLSLNSNIDEWVFNIIDSYERFERVDMSDVITKAGYNIKATAKYLENFYLSK